MKKVEQVNNQGKVVLDYDNVIKSKSKLINLIFDSLSWSERNKFNLQLKNKKYFKLLMEGRSLLIYFKNITYLGNPHPIFKKRIQVKLNEDEINKYNEKKLFIVGFYYYDSNLLFVIPDIKKSKKFNNSSVAHIYTIDLIQSIKMGKYKKIDKNKNEILIFNRFFELIDYIEKKEFKYKNEIFNIIEKFINENLNKNKYWIGQKCYQQMQVANFKHKNQAEWIGFYFEYLFQKYLKENNISTKIIKYLNNEKEIFDLSILNSHYGDLKTHSISSTAVLGNDYKKTQESINNYKKMWIILLKHQPIKDKDLNYQLVKWWNKNLNKKDSSYKDKMKNRTSLTQFQVLEINEDNWKYAGIFNQGKNSDKKSLRKPKYKIYDKNIDNFIIYRKFFD